KARLKVYHDQTEPLISFYSAEADAGGCKYIKINGVGGVDDIRDQIYQGLG
ncbi:MAG: adenylate kinase, partial [Candidatus Thiodiazotropha endolucinida]|nr:adenylate kinase [Candidatus Thiodiazotropha taylori]MCW4239457.1 adenylate kinase [Candidatus Thiodiazotropha taylori]